MFFSGGDAMVGVVVSQRQGLLYRCSSTAGDRFPLSAGRCFMRGVLPLPGGPCAVGGCTSVATVERGSEQWRQRRIQCAQRRQRASDGGAGRRGPKNAQQPGTDSAEGKSKVKWVVSVSQTSGTVTANAPSASRRCWRAVEWRASGSDWSGRSTGMVSEQECGRGGSMSFAAKCG